MENTKLRVVVDGSEEITTSSNRFVANEDFTLEVENKGSARHVYLTISENLEDYVSLRGTNVYVEKDKTEPLGISVETPTETVEGELEITTGYGSTTKTVDLVVKPPENTVEVDESLAQPQPQTTKKDTPAISDRLKSIEFVFFVLLVLSSGVFVASLAYDRSVAIVAAAATVLLGVAVAVLMASRLGSNE